MTLSGTAWYLGAFLLALGTLVVVHELGHYAAARGCGVRVLRFSVGFGRVLWSRRFGGDRTEWAIAAFPLGGYVKMLDEREGPVAESELGRAFNRQSVGRRAIIVGAGPLANLLLAIVLYWALFVHGVEELRPRLAAPPASTPAALAGVADGELVRAANGRGIRTWQELRWEVIQAAMDRKELELEVGHEEHAVRRYRIPTSGLDLNETNSDPLRRLGLVLHRPRLPAVIGAVVAGGAGESGGLRAGDRVIAIDETPVAEWGQVAASIRKAPGQVLRFDILRDGGEIVLDLVPSPADEGGERIGRLGIRAVEPVQDANHSRFIVVSYGVGEGLGKAVRQTWETALFSLRMLGRMLVGELSWRNLSGPVTIADYAGQSAQLGASHYIRFLALISISLGVLNLLPIPVLDGGHLLYYLVEVIKGGPVSERIMEYGQQAGFFLLALLMAFAFYNDIHRLISG